MRFLFRFACLAFVLLAPPGPARALDPASTGIVLLHGKWGDPSNLRPISEALQEAGFTVEAPAMPWAGFRNYDKSFDAGIDEAAEAVARLTAKGVRRIVVGGHSLGGDAALRYAGRDGSVAAILLVAPAHFPEGRKTIEEAGDSVRKAREMVQAGEGDDSAGFVDTNTGGRFRTPRMTARTYLSYYAPDGPAAMSLTAPAVKVGRIGWFAPSGDPTTPIFASLVAPRLPPAVRLDRIDVTSDHMGAPQAAAAAIVTWLKALPEQ